MLRAGPVTGRALPIARIAAPAQLPGGRGETDRRGADRRRRASGASEPAVGTTGANPALAPTEAHGPQSRCARASVPAFASTFVRKTVRQCALDMLLALSSRRDLARSMLARAASARPLA